MYYIRVRKKKKIDLSRKQWNDYGEGFLSTKSTISGHLKTFLSCMTDKLFPQRNHYLASHGQKLKHQDHKMLRHWALQGLPLGSQSHRRMAQTPSPARRQERRNSRPRRCTSCSSWCTSQDPETKGFNRTNSLVAAGTASPSACHLSNLRQALQRLVVYYRNCDSFTEQTT